MTTEFRHASPVALLAVFLAAATILTLAPPRSEANVYRADGDGGPIASAVGNRVSPPSLSIDSGPSEATNDSTPTFGFSSSGTTFTCSIDQGTPAWTPCTSPYTAPGSLADGDWTFRVYAVNELGGEAEQTRNFTVDTMPPDTVFDGTPNEFTNEFTAFFDFHSTEPGSYFQCDFGDDDWAFCSSPATINQLTLGNYTFRVRSTDSAGNVDPTPATFEFEVDQIAPTATIDSGPTGTINTDEAAFTFSANKSQVQFHCSLDGNPAEECISPKTYTDLTDGTHDFAVYATDKFGNVSDTATQDFTVSTGPTGPTTPSNVFTFGKLKLNKPAGTATLQVKVPGAGKVQLLGSKTVKAASRSAGSKSTVILVIKATGKAAKQLRSKGKVTLATRIRFTPTGGTARVKSKTVKLVRKKPKR